jgi:hypothetical protein
VLHLSFAGGREDRPTLTGYIIAGSVMTHEIDHRWIGHDLRDRSPQDHWREGGSVVTHGVDPHPLTAQILTRRRLSADPSPARAELICEECRLEFGVIPGADAYLAEPR